MVNISELKPARYVTPLPPAGEGPVAGYRIRVVPPPFMNAAGGEVILNTDQYERYLAWLDGKGLIQNLLSDISAADREMLMSGLTDIDLFAVGLNEQAPMRAATEHQARGLAVYGLETMLRALQSASATRAVYLAEIDQRAHTANRWHKVSGMLSLLIEVAIDL